MKIKNESYPLYEGSFLTSAAVLDQTVNILMFRDPDNKEYNVIINRALLTEEETPETFCEKEIEALRNKLPGFQVDGRLLTHNIGPAKLPVVQVANNYLQDGERTRQVQSIIQLPRNKHTNPNSRAIIIFTLTTIGDDFTEYQRKHYVQIINSFTPKKPNSR